MIKTVFKIAIRFILYKSKGILGFVRKTFFLAVLSLTISVFSLIVLNSINNGYKNSLNLKLSKMDSDIELIANEISKEEVLNIIDIVESIDILEPEKGLDSQIRELDVSSEKYQALLIEQAIIRFGSKSEGINVLSVDESFEKSKNIYKEFYESNDDYLLLEDEVVLGISLKEKLGVSVGDVIHLFKVNDFIYNTLNRKTKPLKIKGFFKMGDTFEDQYSIVVARETFLKIYKHSKFKNLKIYLTDSKKQDRIKDLLYDKIDFSLHITTFNEKFDTISKSLDQIFNIISIIILFFILLATLNIVSSVSLIVESKYRQIKLLILSGVNLPYILLIFVFISLISIVISFLIGYILAEIVILIQNYYQIISISEEVYIISELIGIVDYGYIFLFLFYLGFTGISLSLILSYRTIYKRGLFNVL